MPKLSCLIFAIIGLGIISCSSSKSNFGKQKYTHFKKAKFVYSSIEQGKLVVNENSFILTNDTSSEYNSFVQDESELAVDSNLCNMSYVSQGEVRDNQNIKKLMQNTFSGCLSTQSTNQPSRSTILMKSLGIICALKKSDDDYKTLTVLGSLLVIVGILLALFLIVAIGATELWLLLLMILVSAPISILGLLILESRTNDKVKTAIKVFLVLSILTVLLFFNQATTI